MYDKSTKLKMVSMTMNILPTKSMSQRGLCTQKYCNALLANVYLSYFRTEIMVGQTWVVLMLVLHRTECLT